MSRLPRMIIGIVLYAIEILLLVKFLLVFFHANLANSFSAWILQTTAPLIAPFANIFPTKNFAGFAWDFTTLFALVIYILIGELLLWLVSLAEYSRPIGPAPRV